MRRKLKNGLLLMILFGLSLNLKGQEGGSLEQYYYMGSGTTFNLIPVFKHQLSNSRYLEFRYNYEDLKTVSVYAGKTFDTGSDFAFSFSPKAGLLLGNINGGSLGVDVELSYKGAYLLSQPQYSFSIKNSQSNFIYSWTDLGYEINESFSAGVSVQNTKLAGSGVSTEKGFMIEPAYKGWSFPVYLYNPESRNRYFVVGLNFQW